MRAEALDLMFGLAPRDSLGEMSVSTPDCERFSEVSVSRRGTANVLECLVADA